MSRIVITFALIIAHAHTVAAVDRKELKPGLVTTYSDGQQTVTRLEPTVGMTLNPTQSPDPRLAGLRSATWVGYINVVEAGEYFFAANTKGSTLLLTVNGKPVPVSGSDSVQLDAGILPFEAKLIVEEPGVQIELLWKGPRFRHEPIPYYVFGHHPKERPARFASDAQIEHGRFLFEELACARCHTPDQDDAMAKTLVERSGPDLSDIGQRVYPGWLDYWLADPHKFRDHAQMPKLFTDNETGKIERYAVVQYLTSLGGPLQEPQRRPLLSNDYRRSVSHGEALFVTTGCAACHGQQLAATQKKTEDDEEMEPTVFDPIESLYGFGSATGAQALYALGAMGSKTRPEVLAKYLQNPLKFNPHGRMPNMQLNASDALDLARYLCRIGDDAISRTLQLDDNGDITNRKSQEEWRKLGRELVVTKGCVNCHTIEPDGKPLSAAQNYPSLTAIRKAIPNSGCLASKPDVSKVPAYALDERQRQAIAAFLKEGLNGAGANSPIHAVRATLKRFNCLNCHERDGEGGIGGELADRMRLLEKAENSEDIQPPRLTQIGYKAQSKWLKSVLIDGGRARPWMTLRMPQYGTHNVGLLVEGLSAAEGTTSDVDSKKLDFTPENIEAGRTLTGKNGLGCISCHDISGIPGGGTRGPDLSLTSERVKYDWYVRWMHNPQRIAPGTRMPQNFIDGKALLTAICGGDADKQIDALWTYLALGPGLPLPVGLEPPQGLVISVKDRPEILRTFMPGQAGTRAIAVGYPDGVSLAFDAHAARLAYAWEGNFLDASPVWNNRGGNPAKLLGAKFLVPPPGHPWAITTSRTPPEFARRADDYAWGAAVPDNHIYQGPKYVSFDGYTLDPAGYPTFRYQVFEVSNNNNSPDILRVFDTPRPIKAPVAAGIARSLRLEVPSRKTVWFLAGVTSDEPRTYGLNGGIMPLNRDDAESEVTVTGTRVVLPQDGGRAVVLETTTAPANSAWRFVRRSDKEWEVLLRLPESDSADVIEVELNTWAIPRDDYELIKSLTKGK
jgi:cbb3-type cytochrome oxidase cytochrome c subunit